MTPQHLILFLAVGLVSSQMFALGLGFDLGTVASDFILDGLAGSLDVLRWIFNTKMRAQVMENTGNVATLEITETDVIEVLRKDLSLSQEEFLDYFAVGTIFPVSQCSPLCSSKFALLLPTELDPCDAPQALTPPL